MLFTWSIYFFIYSFFGWCFETTLDSIEQRKFINRGFLRGPVIPIYGFGAITMLIAAKPVIHSPTLVFICGALSATLLEYFTGFILETIFKTRYWDYSDCHYQIKGRICAEATLMWGFMTLFINYNVHSRIEKLVGNIDQTSAVVISSVLIVIFTADAVISFKTAADINSIIKHLEEIKEESIALTENLKHRAKSSYISKLKEFPDQFSRGKKNPLGKIGIFKLDFLRSNHNAHSIRFNISLSEIKEKLKQYTKKQ